MIRTLTSSMNTTMTMNKIRKIPMRKCVITQERFAKKDLIRVVRTPENQVEIDLTGKKNGRGAYLSNQKEVILLAQKRNTLAKILEVEIPNEIYEELLKLAN